MLHEGGDALSEILTTEQVFLIRQDALTTSIKRIEQLCDSHEKLRMQLAEAEAEFQHQLAEALRLEDERVRWADACTGWALEMQAMEADLLALAKVLIKIDERVRNNIRDHCGGCNGSDCMWDPFACDITDRMHSVMARPSVRRLLAAKEAT